MSKSTLAPKQAKAVKQITAREAARVKAGVSLEEAAEIAAVRTKYLRQLERNPYMNVSFEMAERLARAYKCSMLVFTPKKPQKNKRKEATQ